MTKIAYCLLVHKNPKQVKRLINNLYTRSNIFHVTVFGDNSPPEVWREALKEFESDNFFTTFSKGAAWATFSVVNSTLESMKHFAPFDYDYFINLTGQCYPLQSAASIDKFFDGKNVGYMEEFPMTRNQPTHWGKSGGLDRFENSYYRNSVYVLFYYLLNKMTSSNKETRRFIRIPRINKRPPYNLEPYGGSAYFCLSKQQVSYILEYLKDKPDLIAFFNRTFAPDEMFFQTIIMNSPLRDTIIGDNLRYIDWFKQGVPLPALLTVDDADSLLNSSKLFARKFDLEIAGEILDLIDKSVQKSNLQG